MTDSHEAASDAKRLIVHGRYTLLTVALVFLAAMYPVLGWGFLGLSLWTLAFWSVLLGALHAVGRSRDLRRFARVLALLALSAGVAGLACYQLRGSSHDWIFAAFDGLTLVFLLLATGSILVDVLVRETIDADHLMGAVCVYVLLGLSFAYVLQVLEHVSSAPLLTRVDPGELRPGNGPGLAQAEYLYFSFVTLSTLGYGDLAPVSLPARLMVSVEAILGQLFLTILVARLIGLHLARGRADRE